MGHLFKQQWTTKDPATGKRKKRRSTKWYIQYKDGAGRWKREPAYSDKVASVAMLARREREVARAAEGIFDHLAESVCRPIAEHAADYFKQLCDRGGTEAHATTQRNRILWLCSHGEIDTIQSLSPSRIDSALAKLRAGGRSVSSCNHYLSAVQSFAEWLTNERPQRAPENPLKAMQKKSTRGFETFVRRPLLPEEFDAVRRIAATGKPFEEIDGPAREALYVTAAYTGYRRGELASLTPASFVFGEESYVQCEAASSKRRNLDRIPLHSSAAEFMAQWIAGKPAGQPLWPIGDKRTASMIRADLLAAGVQTTVGNVVVDFHSLRSTFVTSLARAGVIPKIAQQLARHSTIDLTMNVYATLTPEEQRSAVALLPSLTQDHAHPLTQETLKAVNHKKRPLTKSPSADGSRKTTKARKKPTKKPRDT